MSVYVGISFDACCSSESVFGCVSFFHLWKRKSDFSSNFLRLGLYHEENKEFNVAKASECYTIRSNPCSTSANNFRGEKLGESRDPPEKWLCNICLSVKSEAKL